MGLSRSDDRLAVAIALIVLSLVSPNIVVAGSIPAIRAEQVLLLVILPGLFQYYRTRPGMPTSRLVDFGFLALGLSTALTIIVAPLLVDVGRNPRDVFEVARVVEYWLLFRVGFSLYPSRAVARVMLRLLFAAAIPLAALAALQYADPAGFNQAVTSIWTNSHNLDGVIREGRAVGTAGNANQFAILSVLLLCGALASRAFERSGALALAAGTGAVMGILFAQSRGAAAGTAVGLLVGAAFILKRRLGVRAVGRTVTPLWLGAALAVALMVALPPASGNFFSRFDAARILSDPSLVVRVDKLQAMLAEPYPDAAIDADSGTCAAGLLPSSPRSGHSRGTARLPEADPRSVDHIKQVASAVAAYFCDRGAWPTGDQQAVLESSYLHKATRDPVSGGALSTYFNDTGFVLATPSPPDSRPTAIASIPNILADPSFESVGDPARGWLVSGSATLSVRHGDAPFGEQAGVATLDPQGSLYQLLVAQFPRGVPYTFTVWLRNDVVGPLDISLYVIAITSDGRRIDPLATETSRIDADGRWHHSQVTFRIPQDGITSLQVLVRSPSASATVDLDGASVTEGDIAPDFEALRDASAGAVYGGAAAYRDSPIIGVGPQKEALVGTFDNEYLSFLEHYGLLGLATYALLFLAAMRQSIRAGRQGTRWISAMGVALTAATVSLAIFAVSAGAFRQLQFMLIYWILVGLVSRSVAETAARRRSQGEAVWRQSEPVSEGLSYSSGD